MLELLHQDGQTKRLETSFTEVLEYFAEDENSCLEISKALANLGLGEYCQQVQQKAGTLGIEDPQLSLDVVKGYLKSGRYLEAEDLSNRLLRKAGNWKVGYQQTMLTGLKALTQFGLENQDAGKIQLREFFRAELELPPDEQIYQLANLFYHLNFKPQAREILLHGKEHFPSYRPILQDLVKIDLESRNFAKLPNSIRDMLASRRKEIHLLINCRNMLASDFFMFYPDQNELLDSLSNSLQNIEEQGALPKS